MRWRSIARAGSEVQGARGEGPLSVSRLPAAPPSRGADDTAARLSHQVSVDHRGLHVLVPQQLLNRADVVPRLQEVRGERVSERVTGDTFGKTRIRRRPPYRARERAGVTIPPLPPASLLVQD